MSAMQIIEQIKGLPERERAEVMTFLGTLRAEENTASCKGQMLSFDEAVDVVFRENGELLRKLAQ